jgi:branched-subunit amino acid transport protein
MIMVDICEQFSPVGFMVDKVALGQVFLQVLQFIPITVTPPIFYIHIKLICHK